MINTKKKSIRFSENDELQDIFSELSTLVQKIKNDKEISVFDASELSILNTEIMEHIINLVNYSIDLNHNENKKSPMIESCEEYQALCSYIQNIDNFDKFVQGSPDMKTH
tara:strand:- start:508 stop:837 length:330 start_codon:yes stop_codon:yes gene_type:complete